MSVIVQYLKDLVTERYNKRNRIQKLKNKAHSIDKVPLSTFCLNTFLFSPFLLLSFFIVAPYMMDDHLPTLCTMTSYTSRQDGYYNNYYTNVNVNYTLESGTFSGVYKTCVKSNFNDRELCETKLPSRFQCFVDKFYDPSTKSASQNSVWTIQDYFDNKNMLVRNIGIGYGSFIFFMLFCVGIYFVVDWVMDNFIHKITDADLDYGKVNPNQFNLKISLNLSNDEIYLAALLFEKSVFNWLAHTAKEPQEDIEWCEKPPLIKLLFSHGWIIGPLCLIGCLPLVLLMIGAAIYGLFYYSFQNWALPLIEFAMGYILFVYIFYIFALIIAARGTRYYITSRRAISVIQLFGTVWINQISFDEIGYVDTANNSNRGAIFVRSRHHLVMTKLFSYISDIEYVISLIKNKLPIQSDPYTEEKDDLQNALGSLETHQTGIVEVNEGEDDSFPTPVRGESVHQINVTNTEDENFNEIELQDV